mmetsp:Transcript_3247/g.6729  ORF Transcript_3247/g.6729 Transcript_3247/m.6729 type:complete len:442 (-) Transcript_3247:836-2161(-)
MIARASSPTPFVRDPLQSRIIWSHLRAIVHLDPGVPPNALLDLRPVRLVAAPKLLRPGLAPESRRSDADHVPRGVGRGLLPGVDVRRDADALLLEAIWSRGSSRPAAAPRAAGGALHVLQPAPLVPARPGVRVLHGGGGGRDAAAAGPDERPGHVRVLGGGLVGRALAAVPRVGPVPALEDDLAHRSLGDRVGHAIPRLVAPPVRFPLVGAAGGVHGEVVEGGTGRGPDRAVAAPGEGPPLVASVLGGGVLPAVSAVGPGPATVGHLADGDPGHGHADHVPLLVLDVGSRRPLFRADPDAVGGIEVRRAGGDHVPRAVPGEGPRRLPRVGRGRVGVGLVPRLSAVPAEGPRVAFEHESQGVDEVPLLVGLAGPVGGTSPEVGEGDEIGRGRGGDGSGAVAHDVPGLLPVLDDVGPESDGRAGLVPRLGAVPVQRGGLALVD